MFSPHMGFLVKNSVREGQISESWQEAETPCQIAGELGAEMVFSVSFPEM